MERMQDYIKSVRINLWIIETLLTIFHDRLGDFITFELVKHPNESISSFKCFDWFKHVVSLLGYHYPHLEEMDFGEMAEAWIYDSNLEKIRVRHKYWSAKQCQLCIDLLKPLCAFHGIPIEFYREPK